MKTWKQTLAKILLGTLALALVLPLISATPAQASSAVLRFDPASATISTGQTVSINIQIDSVSNLMGAELHMSFNPAILEVQDANGDPSDGVQVSLGSFLKPDFVAQNRADNTQGTIDLSFLQMSPHSPVSGSGVLGTITFRAKSSGTSTLNFASVNLADGGAAAISVTPQNGQVQVDGGGSPTLTPTPTYPTPTPQPGNPTPTPQPSYPTPTPQPGYPTPTPTPAPPQAGILGYHTVRARESLFCIGRAYTVSPWAIASQNNISYPYYLRIGQVLAIPSAQWTNPVAGPVCPAQFGGGTPQPTPPPSSGCQAIHIVERGDTLSSIARRYGKTVWAIAVANNISNPNLIFPGQKLCIP